MPVITIKSAEQFQKILDDAQHVMVDFTATWCGPCKRIAPVFKQLSDDHPNVIFCKIDVDDCGDIATQYKVRAMPTFILISSGNVADRMEGADAEKLAKMVALAE